MDKFEYKIVSIKTIEDNAIPDSDWEIYDSVPGTKLPRNHFLTKLGKEGWELTAIYEGFMYFKRRKEVSVGFKELAERAVVAASI